MLFVLIFMFNKLDFIDEIKSNADIPISDTRFKFLTLKDPLNLILEASLFLKLDRHSPPLLKALHNLQIFFLHSLMQGMLLNRFRLILAVFFELL